MRGAHPPANQQGTVCHLSTFPRKIRFCQLLGRCVAHDVNDAQLMLHTEQPRGEQLQVALPPLPDREGLQCVCACARVFSPDLSSIPGCNLAVKRTFISDPPTCNSAFSPLKWVKSKFHVQTSTEVELEELKYLNHVAFIRLARQTFLSI